MPESSKQTENPPAATAQRKNVAAAQRESVAASQSETAAAAQVEPAPHPALPKIVPFTDLARCGDEIWISHLGQLYRLQSTKSGKLILTK